MQVVSGEVPLPVVRVDSVHFVQAMLDAKMTKLFEVLFETLRQVSRPVICAFDFDCIEWHICSHFRFSTIFLCLEVSIAHYLIIRLDCLLIQTQFNFHVDVDLRNFLRVELLCDKFEYLIHEQACFLFNVVSSLRAA